MTVVEYRTVPTLMPLVGCLVGVVGWGKGLSASGPIYLSVSLSVPLALSLSLS
jgi:hypothetical protein